MVRREEEIEPGETDNRDRNIAAKELNNRKREIRRNYFLTLRLRRNRQPVALIFRRFGVIFLNVYYVDGIIRPAQSGHF